jgi:hypothetical protein
MCNFGHGAAYGGRQWAGGGKVQRLTRTSRKIRIGMTTLQYCTIVFIVANPAFLFDIPDLTFYFDADPDPTSNSFDVLTLKCPLTCIFTAW